MENQPNTTQEKEPVNEQPENSAADNPNQPSHAMLHIERGRDGTEFTHRYGAAWTNDDGDIDMKLNGMPLDGRLTARPMEKLKRLREERAQAAAQPDQQPDIGQP